MEQDESTETEIPPHKQHTFSGMGGGGENSGKYDGFGNSPIQKGTFWISSELQSNQFYSSLSVVLKLLDS